MDDHMSNEPLVSVIVPVYGVEPFLDRCVESIVGQTYKNLQIILVDDGSPDNCPAMCDAWAEKDSRIQVIHKENGGLSDARNAGLAVADGEYIGFVDSDDWLDPRFFEVLYQAAAKHDCQISECDYIVTSGAAPEEADIGETVVCAVESAMERHLLDKMFRQVVWNKLYRREVITVLFEKGKYHEDVFWTYQIIANCDRLAHVDVAMYCYFQREDSIMGQEYSLKRLDAVEAAVRRCRFVSEQFPQLAGIAQGQLIGSCMYHCQLILKNAEIDLSGLHRKWIHHQANQAGNLWKYENRFSKVQKIWLENYLKRPNAVCKIRNLLKIGF